MDESPNEQTWHTTGAGQPIAQDVADSLSHAAGQAATTARHASEGVTEFRALIRNQPVTMAVLMLGLGYVLGRVVRGGQRRDDRR